jgi:hypothetical protein
MNRILKIFCPVAERGPLADHCRIIEQGPVRNVPRPTAALLKAVLLVGTTRLSGYAPKSALLDNHQGFGRVNLDAALAPPPPARLNFRKSRRGCGRDRATPSKST